MEIHVKLFCEPMTLNLKKTFRVAHTASDQRHNVLIRIEQDGLADDISFIGHRKDMREIYAVSDLVLSLSTRPESFGRTVLEALSLGRPVVGYDHGGVGEVLGNVYPVGRVPLGDVGALAERVEELLTDPQSVPRHHPYQLSGMLAATLGLYEELVGAHID